MESEMIKPSIVEFDVRKCPVCQEKVLNMRNVRLVNNTDRHGKCTLCSARFKVRNMELIFVGFKR